MPGLGLVAFVGGGALPPGLICAAVNRPTGVRAALQCGLIELGAGVAVGFIASLLPSTRRASLVAIAWVVGVAAGTFVGTLFLSYVNYSEYLLNIPLLLLAGFFGIGIGAVVRSPDSGDSSGSE